MPPFPEYVDYRHSPFVTLSEEPFLRPKVNASVYGST